MRAAKLRDAEISSGMSVNISNSLLHYSNEEIIHNANQLGVSLGANDSEISNSVNDLLDLEAERALESFTQKGSVGIKVNGDISHYFQTHKGLRRGDPMFPILFNIVVDMLAILIGRAKEVGQVGGLVPHLVDGGVSILQYADDTIIFMEHDLAKVRNMKLVLCLFEQMTA